jgi:hypothetical protein
MLPLNRDNHLSTIYYDPHVNLQRAGSINQFLRVTTFGNSGIQDNSWGNSVVNSQRIRTGWAPDSMAAYWL